MKTSIALCLCIFLLTLVGCDCAKEAKGYVFDEVTKQPLAGVTVDLYWPGHNDEVAHLQATTAEDGSFLFRHDYCADYMVIFYKPGYYHFTVDRKDQMDVYMRLEE